MTEEEKIPVSNSKPIIVFLALALAVVSAFAVIAWRKAGSSSQTGDQLANNPQPTVVPEEQGQGQTTPSQQTSPAQTEVLGAESIRAITQGGITSGPANAKVTIVEFSDPSCPFCMAVAGSNQEVIDYLRTQSPNWQPALPLIEKEYIDTGKVRIIFHYFPGHGTGQEATKAIWCAGEQGKGWEAKVAVYAMGTGIEKLDPQALAEELGIDKTKMAECTKKDFSAKFQEETNLGQSVGIQGTPTFFVNGRVIRGAQDYSYFKGFIDSELAK